MLGAVFMATDMATSPVTPRGMWIYGGLIGLLTVMIRYYGGLPEGVMYAILIGNAATPLIEQSHAADAVRQGRTARRAPAAPPIRCTPSYIPREGKIATCGPATR